MSLLPLRRWDRAGDIGLRGRIAEFRRHVLRRHPTMAVSGVVLIVMCLAAVFAPLLFTSDPIALNPVQRLRAPGAGHRFGTDMFGRDIHSRTVYGTRISLTVELAAAAMSVTAGLAIGLLAGYIRILDGIVMLIMDGLMSIPAILLAIALVSLAGSSLVTVTIAIRFPAS